MERYTAEKFKTENHTAWILGMWSAMPVEVRIAEICGNNQEEGYAKVDFIHNGESRASGSEDVCLGDIYESKEELIATMFEDMQKKTAEIESAVQTKDDCIRFMFSHSVSGCAEFTDWTARRAIQKIALERWGLDLR